MSSHDAVDSTLGYTHQLLSSLLILLESNDDESVSIEAVDDIAIHGGVGNHAHTRLQVAHTLDTSPAAITVKTPKLWKTFRIWASEYSQKQKYVLITCADVDPVLQPLVDDTDRVSLQGNLEVEAERVIADVSLKPGMHSARIKGCEEFIALTPATRLALLRQTRILAASPNILTTDARIDHHFRNIARPEQRVLIVQRVREYWQNRATKSLTEELSSIISKSELQQYIEEITAAVVGTSLPDDFGTIAPPDSAETPQNLKRQIELVNGGPRRIARARVAHWRSRNQRDRWLDDDITFDAELNKFDDNLIEAWGDQHGPICDDTKDLEEAEKRSKGRNLLDWTHVEAPSSVFKVGRKAAPPCVVQGSYQDLANRKKVGWHPNYEAMMKKEESDGK